MSKQLWCSKSMTYVCKPIATIMKLHELVIDTFGTKELAARKLGISRWTLYRYIDNPNKMPLHYLKKISEYSNTNICEYL